MTRYVKRVGRIGFSLGPSEERGFSMWVGYDIPGIDRDLSHLGLERVDLLDAEALARRDVRVFARVEPGDHETCTTLGLSDHDFARGETTDD